MAEDAKPGGVKRGGSPAFGAKGKRVRLSARTVEAALQAHASLRAAGAGKLLRVWDATLPDLFLKITTAGCASYLLRYTKPAGGVGEYTIGRADRISAEQAREVAREKIAELELRRIDPVEERRENARKAQERKRRTFEALAAEYLSAPRRKPLASRTREEMEWRLKRFILPRIGSRPYEELRAADLRACVRDIWRDIGGGPQSRKGSRTANLCHQDIKAVFGWAFEEEMVQANPAAFGKLFDDRAVKRIGALNDERVRVIWGALAEEKAKGWGEATCIAIMLCFVTLQRPNEIAKAHRDDFDWEARTWRIHPDRSKTGSQTRAHYEVPLTDKAATLFKEAFAQSGKGPWAFPLKGRPKEHIDPQTLTGRFFKLRRRLVKQGLLPAAETVRGKRCDIQLYDVKRFGRTALEERLGFPEHIAERVINHSNRESGIRRLYNVADLSAQVRRAHEAWAAELERIVAGLEAGATVNVVPFANASVHVRLTHPA